MVPPPPAPPPQVQANPELFRNPYKTTREILIAAKAALKVVPKVIESVVKKLTAPGVSAVDSEHSYVLANLPSPAMEISVNDEGLSVTVNTSGGETQFFKPKKERGFGTK